MGDIKWQFVKLNEEKKTHNLGQEFYKKFSVFLNKT